MRIDSREPELITSRDNPTIRFARNLQRRRFRDRERAILLEGVRTIQTAIHHGARLRTLLIDARQIEALPAGQLQQLAGAANRVLRVSGEAFDTVADTEHPQACVAIADMPQATLPAHPTMLLVLDAVRDPGNLGTLIRSAAATGTDGVVLLPGCADPYNPKAIRSSVGLVYALPVVRVASPGALREHGGEQQLEIILAAADGAHLWDQVDWTRPFALALGGEAAGATMDMRTYADLTVSLPMAPGIESLNVAAAGAALLYEAVRQRRARDIQNARTYAENV